MNAKALKILEFIKIRQQLQSQARTFGGQRLAESLEPYDTIERVEHHQQQTAEALQLSMQFGSLRITVMHDLSNALKRLAIGGNLSMVELLHIGDVLSTVSKIKSYQGHAGGSLEAMSIRYLFEGLDPVQPLQREISRCIISEEEMSDNASPGLRNIRREIQNTHGRIRSQLNKIINSSTHKTMLQDPIVTMRNDRFCVPVKAEYRSRFPGMIHDQSSTGSTLFIEPMAVVEMNNQLSDLATEETKEIERILAELSALAAEHIDVLKENMALVAQLDFIFAKSELAIKMNATRPIYKEERFVNLKKARHPLLDPKEVVPIDIYLGNDFTTLVITGPNTGGKTVTLKTLGLLTLMGQSGLHIPTMDQSQLMLVDEIFADIGDEQSIEQSLSTFSSHMVNIVDILQHATPRSLCLFDELGAGTDPVEGAALAMAILENLFARDIMTLATTHYSELKVYALSTDGVENASCEFDVISLRPTYKLLIGIPGKSNAFAISKRLGLGEDIISEAKDLLQQKEVRFEDLITDLEANKKEALTEKENAVRYRQEAEELHAQVDAQKAKLAQQRETFLSDAKREAYSIIQKAKSEADSIIKDMNRVTSDTKALEENRAKLRGMQSDMEKSLASKKKKSGSAPKNLSIGDKVHVSTFDQTGIVLTNPSNKKEVQVQMGIMKVTVPLSNLTLIKEDTKSKEKQAGRKTAATTSGASSTYSISSEIDVRGMSAMDAIMAIDKYLDDAYLSKLKQVTIIHGKGTGVLRTEIQRHLKKVSTVKSYRLGNYGEGEAGVTIVELK